MPRRTVRRLVPLSFDWDAEALVVATPMDSPTGTSPATIRTVRLGSGGTRDVSAVEVVEIDALSPRRVTGSPRGARAHARCLGNRYGRWSMGAEPR